MSGTGQLPELESLRSQLADVARELAERDRTLLERATHRDRERQDLREQSAQLLTIAQRTAAKTGDDFLTELVNQLTTTLSVRYAVIGHIADSPVTIMRTIAVSSGGTLVDNFEHPLEQTPCETALTEGSACFAHGVQRAFPRFTLLTELGIDSYCGVSIRNNEGAVIGLLAVMDTKPLHNTEWLQSVLTVFAARAGAEL
ncbi:MAG: GAF domain-containing protein, partial [Nitrospira sp.]